MKNTYVYTPDARELVTAPDLSEKWGTTKVQLAKSPCGGKGLPKVYTWVQTVDGRFIDMVRRACLVKV